MDIAPKMTLEIFKPEFPKRVYSIFGAIVQATSIEGIIGQCLEQKD
jgi:hypothetical protein